MKLTPLTRLTPVVFLLCAVVACESDSQIPTPPLTLSFAAGKAGERVESDLRIKEKIGYTFSLGFLFKKNDPLDRARVKKLVGDSQKNEAGKVTNPGISVPLRLKISQLTNKDEKLMFSKESSEHELYANDDHSFDKKIADVPLDPGNYRISIESLADVPELIGTEIKFRIARTHGK